MNYVPKAREENTVKIRGIPIAWDGELKPLVGDSIIPFIFAEIASRETAEKAVLTSPKER